MNNLKNTSAIIGGPKAVASSELQPNAKKMKIAPPNARELRDLELTRDLPYRVERLSRYEFRVLDSETDQCLGIVLRVCPGEWAALRPDNSVMTRKGFITRGKAVVHVARYGR